MRQTKSFFAKKQRFLLANDRNIEVFFAQVYKKTVLNTEP